MGPQLVQRLEVGGQRGSTHHAPHIACASVVGSNNKATIQGHSDAAHCCAHLWHKLTAAGIGCEVPYSDVTMLVP